MQIFQKPKSITMHICIFTCLLYAKKLSDIYVLKVFFCIVYFKLYLNLIHLKIAQLDKKMEDLKAEKHDLFSQLKKVLHQEDETRKKAQLKEQRYEFNAFSTGSTGSCLKR